MQDIYLSQNETVGANHDLLLFQIATNALNNVMSLKYIYFLVQSGVFECMLTHELDCN